MSQPLFPAPSAAPLQLSTQFHELGGQKGAYARYRPVRRVACDECIAFLHQNKGIGPVPRGARISRRAFGEMLRLCGEHADLWREKDGGLPDA